MNALFVSDLGRAFALNRNSSTLSADLSRLSTELSTGRIADVRATPGSKVMLLSSLDRTLSDLAAFGANLSDASLEAQTAQRTIDAVRSRMSSDARGLIGAQSGLGQVSISAALTQAASSFDAMVADLNTTIGGRTLFAGEATDAAALSGSKVMTAAIIATLPMAPGVEDIEAAISAYFEPGGEFETTGYQGGDAPVASRAVSVGDALDALPTALSEDMRPALKAYALASVATALDGTLSYTNQRQLAEAAGRSMLEADSRLVKVAADIGAIEGKIEARQVSNAAERYAVELARAEIIEVDPFEIASELQAVQAQLESLYTVTARLSSLRLSNYL